MIKKKKRKMKKYWIKKRTKDIFLGLDAWWHEHKSEKRFLFPIAGSWNQQLRSIESAWLIWGRGRSGIGRHRFLHFLVFGGRKSVANSIMNKNARLRYGSTIFFYFLTQWKSLNPNHSPYFEYTQWIIVYIYLYIYTTTTQQ